MSGEEGRVQPMSRRDRLAVWLARRCLRLASKDYRYAVQAMRVTTADGSFVVLAATAPSPSDSDGAA